MRSLARLTEGGGITYEEGEREGGCFECSFRVKETVNRSIAGAAGEREKERKEGREGEREIMEEKECVNQPVSGGERSWGEEREKGRKKRSVGEERERERERGGVSLELSCRRMRALRLAAEGEARQRLLIHQDPPTNPR